MTPEEREARRVRAMRARKLRNMGRPQLVLPHEFDQVKALVVRGHKAGMTHAQMADQVDVNKSSISNIINGKYVTCKRGTYDKMMRLQVTGPEAETTGDTRHSSARYESVGGIRRLQALTALGFSAPVMASLMDVGAYPYVRWITDNEPAYLYWATVVAIDRAYGKLHNADPLDFGIRPQHVRRMQKKAADLLWAPPHCWDADTIDDPDAFPEWTGECGTTGGYYLHLKYDILVKEGGGDSAKRKRKVLCAPCLDARRNDFGVVRNAERDDEIMEALKEGVQYRAIAEDFGITVRTVQRVAADLKKTGWEPPKRGPRKKEEEA